MSFEENYYENMDLWDRTAASEADCERVATVARKVPADVRTVLDVGCGNGIFLHYLGVMKEHPFTRSGCSNLVFDCASCRGMRGRRGCHRGPL